MFVCVREGDYTALLYIFYVLALDARCQLPAHTHCLEPEPVSVFITSSLWTVKNRKCFSSSSSHLHAQTHIHIHKDIHTQTTSVTPFPFLLVAAHILSGHQKRLKEFIRVYFILVLNMFSGLLHYCFYVKAWESKHEKSLNPSFHHTTAVSLVFL